MISFGLDMSGYSSGRTTLARLVLHRDHSADAIVFEVDSLKQKLPGATEIGKVVEVERDLIRACIEVGPLAVDVPIDLQGLPETDQPHWVWQLTLRPIDYAFAALPPLADRIGSPVARFRNVMRGLGGPDSALLGSQLYETYPAACLRQLGISDRGYKSCSLQRKDSSWIGISHSKESQTNIHIIAEKLGLNASSGLLLNDDDLDSIICAIACIDIKSYSVTGARLRDIMNDRLGQKLDNSNNAIRLGHYHDTPLEPPRGYVLLDRLPTRSIMVQRKVLSSIADLKAVVLNSA